MLHFKYSRIVSIITLVSFIAACSAPQHKDVDTNWIIRNCLDAEKVISLTDHTCEQFSNCEYFGSKEVKCNFDGGYYIGTCFQKEFSGRGEYHWTTGHKFRGLYKNDKQFCGIQDDGDKYIIYKGGKQVDSGSASARTAGLVAAALVTAAAVAAANSGGGGAYASDYDWDWDYLPGSGQWRCRGIQTGQFADNSKCAYDIRDDDRWP